MTTAALISRVAADGLYKRQPAAAVAVRPHPDRAGDRRRVPQARSAHPGQEPGDVRGRDRLGADHDLLHPRPVRSAAARWSGANALFSGQITLWLWFTVLFANFAEAVAEGRGKAQADTPAPHAHRHQGQAPHRTAKARQLRSGRRGQAQAGRHRAGRDRRLHPERRRGDRGRRLGRRIRHHRRIGAGHPRKRRRPFGGHRRHARHLRLDQGQDHRGAGLHLPRPHDRPGRGRGAAEDAQRDRAQHPAGGHDHHLRLRHRHHPELRRLCRRRGRRSWC